MSFLSKVKETFHKVINGPNDAASQALVLKTEECTSEFLLNTDWNLQLELCDMVNSGNVGYDPKRCLHSIPNGRSARCGLHQCARSVAEA
jgi:hypothetical protein